MASYDYYKRKDTGSLIPNLKPGGDNWFFIQVRPGLQPMNTADTLKLFKTKNHWILKNGFYRVATATTGAASADIGISGTGQEVTAALPSDSASDTWVRFTAVDDDNPLEITADGYIWYENLDAAVDDGVVDLLFEWVIPHTSVGSMTSNEG